MPEQLDPLIGTAIRGHVLLKPLGHGAMGAVYLARHSETAQEVAVKFLSADYCSKKEFVNRFMNEGAACALLDHAHIVKVYEVGEEGEIHFMVMEYVDGVDLAHFLEVQDKVKESQAVPWIKQVAQALSYAHSCGIVHRDLKPENIMVCRDGHVKLMDLGLSKNLEADENFSMTMSGTVIGTPYYISPEQARDAKHIDARTDIYSLGAAFYHLVTGFPPFQGNSAAEVMSKHMNDQLVDPQRKNNTISDGFSDLIMHMMEKDPSRRFQSMQEVAEAIDRLERGEPVLPHKVRLRKVDGDAAAARTAHPNWKARVLGLVLMAVMVTFLIWFLRPPEPGTEPAPPKSPPKAGTATPVPPLPPPETGNPPGSQPITTVPNPPTPGPATDPGGNPPQPQGATTTQDPPDDEGVTITGSGQATRIPIEGSANWVDLFGLLAILLAIPVAQRAGWFWATLRAGAIWVAVVVVCRYFGDIGQWVHAELKVPPGGAAVLAFLAMTIIVMLPAWVFTHRLLGHQKETWQRRLNRRIAIVPGIVLGIALAIWFMALVAVLASNVFPVRGSWLGSKVLNAFTAVDQAATLSEAAAPK